MDGCCYCTASVGTDRTRQQRRVLIAGNYCHDTIYPPQGDGSCNQSASGAIDTLGGSAAYVSNVLDSLQIECEVVAKVGEDFAYSSRVLHAPLVVRTSPTTHFMANYAVGHDRTLHAIRRCDPIVPSDLAHFQCHHGHGHGHGHVHVEHRDGDVLGQSDVQCARVHSGQRVVDVDVDNDVDNGARGCLGQGACGRCYKDGGDVGCDCSNSLDGQVVHREFCSSSKVFDLGLAVGVAGEILPETLETIVHLCKRVIVDLQALIRVIHPESGEVMHQKLEEGPFEKLLHRITFIKAAQSEAKYLDIETARQKTCVIVTLGEKGSIVYLKDRELQVPAFPTVEVDPTGAGDSFLGGFVAGLHGGLSIREAALLGNYFGSLAVSQVGIPRFTELQIQDCGKVFESLQRREDQ